MFKALSWVFGSIFLLFGVLITFLEPKVGIVSIAISLLLLPPVRSFAFSKTNIALSTKIRTGFVSVLVITAMVFMVQGGTDIQQAKAVEQAKSEEQKKLAIQQENIKAFQASKDTILAEIKALIDKKEYKSAIDKAKPYLASNDSDLKTIYDLAVKQQNIRSTWDAINKVPIEPNNFGRLKDLYQQLANLQPEDKTHQENVDYYTKQIKVVEENKKKAELQAKEDAERKVLIEKQFSQWDGSHVALERLIKKGMHDPSSYEHVETKYIDRKDHIFVITTFRGNNAFGAKILNTAKATFDMNGNLKEVVQLFN